MKRKLVAVLSVATLSIGVGLPATPESMAGPAPSNRSAPLNVDTNAAVVQLTSQPLSVAARTRPLKGKKIDLNSASVKNERARLAAVRNNFRKWLRTNAPGVQITHEFDLALHAVSVELNGVSLDTLRGAPMVVSAEHEQVFTPVVADPDLSLVHAQEAWGQLGGPENAGRGVKVAIIDSGIDVTHPCFSDADTTLYPPQTQLGDTRFTNNKVIVARVYSNRIKQDGWDASAINSHGTHVAGTVACNFETPAVIEGAGPIPYAPSGVAPAALLGNYNVFPGEAGSARSEDILQALEQAYTDGFDVANMSLGGARNDGGGAFLLNNAINNLDRANMVVAVAAGNEGPDYWTVHYPGAALRALTAGASTVGHSIVNFVIVNGQAYEAVVGEFGSLAADLTDILVVVEDPSSGFPHGLNLGCDESPPLPPEVANHIVLLGRGTCEFTVKMRNAENAGAIGVIMVNRVPGEPPFVMAHNGTDPQPDIPGVMVSLEDGLILKTQNGATTTIQALGTYTLDPESTNDMAGFSSVGPTHGDVLIKPDVVAPGADVLSAFPSTHCENPEPLGCWSFLGGTSMATPHLAGAAAVVRGAHPTWTAAQVRSSIVNTAQQGLLHLPGTDIVTDDAMIVGSGLLDVNAAVGAVSALDPVSKSFGAVSSGAGKSKSASIVVTNLTGAPQTFAVAVSDTADDGAAFGTSATTVSLRAGASRTISVSVAVSKGAPDGHKQATLIVSRGGLQVAHTMLFTLVGSGAAAPGQHMLPPPKA